MTTIATGQANAFTALIGAAILEGVATRLAANIMASFSQPLGAGPLAFAMLPTLFNLRCGTLAPGCPTSAPLMPEPRETWTAQMTGRNTADIALGDGYRLEIDERSSQMTIINDASGQRTRIWGDPHVEVNGQHKFDFWGTSTFTLENGTKITINTEQWAGNPNAYVASQVVITKGSNAIVVDGISQNQLGDLKVSMSNDGHAIDAAHRDGWTIHEQAGSTGWSTECGKQVTQCDANITAIGALYGPGSEAMSMAEAGQLLGTFLLFGMLSFGLSPQLARSEANIQSTRAQAFRAALTL